MTRGGYAAGVTGLVRERGTKVLIVAVEEHRNCNG
jgi:hypothetical protein